MIRKQENSNNKLAFTLFEVVVTMGIVAIFIAACSNVFTAKHKNRVANPPHGRFECYWDDNGELHQRTFFENVFAGDEIRTEQGNCRFEPTRDASYVIVSAVGGGGAGGAQFGGNAGEYINEFMSSTTHVLELYPGKAATINSTTPTYEFTPAEPSFVRDIGVDGNSSDNPKEILRVMGGESSFYGNTSGTVKFGGCSVTFARYSCGVPYSCEANNTTKKVTVHRCIQDIQSPPNPYQYVTTSVWTYNEILAQNTGTIDDLVNGIIKFDSISYDTLNPLCNINSGNRNYSIALTILGNNTEDEEISPMGGYLSALNIEGGIAAVTPSPGNGGAKENVGGNGAILVVW